MRFTFNRPKNKKQQTLSIPDKCSEIGWTNSFVCQTICTYSMNSRTRVLSEAVIQIRRKTVVCRHRCFDGAHSANVVFRLTEESHVDVHGTSDMSAALVSKIHVSAV